VFAKEPPKSGLTTDANSTKLVLVRPVTTEELDAPLFDWSLC